MDCSLIPKAVKVTSQRRPKTPHDGYTIHNAPIFLSSCPPRSQSFQWSSFRSGLDIAISSVELSFSPLSSFLLLPWGWEDDEVCECCRSNKCGSCLHFNFCFLTTGWTWLSIYPHTSCTLAFRHYFHSQEPLCLKVQIFKKLPAVQFMI